MAGVVADGTQKRQLAPTLQYVAEQHGAKPERPENQPQAAKCLERRQICILNLVKRRQPLISRDGVEAEIGEAVFERRGHFTRTLHLCVYQEEPIPIVVRERPLKMPFADDELALEDAVGERRHDPEPDRPIGVAIEHEVVAHREMERIAQRR